jgi:hypothetical protein
MASTYSPKLRFELIGAGEQAGLWGSTTNKNIGQLIEQAIAGVTTVELDGLSGNYTLTALDGAPDQSRSAVILCTYAAVPASGAINLIVPTQTKLYLVRNDCGQTITVKTSAQVGGVQLLNGEATLVFCDGTDAIAGIQTAGVGPTTVANGGTGASTFTGGFIKSPSPFGTTTLTSVSTVNAATELSNQVPVANGGTNIASYTAGDILYASGSTTLTKLPIGSSGQVLTVSGGGIPSWSAGGAVTSVTGSGINVSPTTGAVVVSLTGTNVTNALGFTPPSLSGTNNWTGANTFSSGSITSDEYNFNATSSIYLSSSTVKIDISSNNIAIFDQSGSAYRLRFNNTTSGIQYSGSSVEVGFLSGTYLSISSGQFLTNTDNVLKPNSGSWGGYSDQRLKENIVDYSKGLSAIKALRPINYNFIGELGEQTNHKTYTGLIAQEVEQTPLATMVSEGSNGYKILDPSELTYALVNAVKELSAQVDSLKAEVAALKGA